MSMALSILHKWEVFCFELTTENQLQLYTFAYRKFHQSKKHFNYVTNANDFIYFIHLQWAFIFQLVFFSLLWLLNAIIQ